MLAEASNFRIDFLPSFAWALLSDKCAEQTICHPVCHRNLQNEESGLRHAINTCHHFPSGVRLYWRSVEHGRVSTPVITVVEPDSIYPPRVRLTHGSVRRP